MFRDLRLSEVSTFFGGVNKYYKAFHHGIRDVWKHRQDTHSSGVSFQAGREITGSPLLTTGGGKTGSFLMVLQQQNASLLYSSWCGFSTKERKMKSLAFYSCNHANNWLCHGLGQHLVVSLQFASINQKGLSEFGPESTTGLSYWWFDCLNWETSTWTGLQELGASWKHILLSVLVFTKVAELDEVFPKSQGLPKERFVLMLFGEILVGLLLTNKMKYN